MADFVVLCLAACADLLLSKCKFSFEALGSFLLLIRSGLLVLDQLFDLLLILRFEDLEDGLLAGLLSFFVLRSTLLELVERDFELALRLQEVPLVVVLLRLQELDLALPESLVAVVGALQVL